MNSIKLNEIYKQDIDDIKNYIINNFNQKTEDIIKNIDTNKIFNIYIDNNFMNYSHFLAITKFLCLEKKSHINKKEVCDYFFKEIQEDFIENKLKEKKENIIEFDFNLHSLKVGLIPDDKYNNCFYDDSSCVYFYIGFEIGCYIKTIEYIYNETGIIKNEKIKS